jgi:serine/threonine-protein kinase HipA
MAKAINKFSANPGLDLVNFYELLVFCFLTGNNDMHLKNFSLLKKQSDYGLCPAYDLVASELALEGDDEELALTLNGKKKKMNRNDFEIAMKGVNFETKVIENIFKKFNKLIPKWEKFIQESFLPESLKIQYKSLISRKAKQIGF